MLIYLFDFLITTTLALMGVGCPARFLRFSPVLMYHF